MRRGTPRPRPLPPLPISPAFCTAALGPRDGAVRAAARCRAAPRKAGRGRGASRCRQVGVTLGPSLAPAARSAVREPRGDAAPRSAQRPPRRGGWRTEAAAGAGDGPPGRCRPLDVPCVRGRSAPGALSERFCHSTARARGERGPGCVRCSPAAPEPQNRGSPVGAVNRAARVRSERITANKYSVPAPGSGDGFFRVQIRFCGCQL